MKSSSFYLLSTLFCSSIFLAASFVIENEDFTFENYLIHFDKTYNDSHEWNLRRSIFETNRQRIHQHNAGNSSFQLGFNVFTDQVEKDMPLGYDKSKRSSYSNKEMLSSFFASTTHAPHRSSRSLLQLPHILTDVPLSSLPKEVDWRTISGVTTPIKNQGGCGSCWAFASTAALESHIAIATDTLYSLSMQEMVSCIPNPHECGGEGGCTGATAELAFDWVAKHGIVEEWSFSYQSGHGTVPSCDILANTTSSSSSLLLRGELQNKDSPTNPDSDSAIVKGAVASIAGYVQLPSNEYHPLMVAVATLGPVVVSVAASGWGLYKGGVYNDDNQTERDLNHAVVLEGYGTDQDTGEDYWLVRNSWGPRWGEHGYIRLKRVDPSSSSATGASTTPIDDCKMDSTPGDGDACKTDEHGAPIKPTPISVCGTSGILYDSVIPIGGHLL